MVYARDGKTIVFCQTKAEANDLILTDKIKLDIEVMHGDIAQNQREVTIKRFKEGKFNVLVATDVASRGLDIPDVDLVIQVQPPQETEVYIHRSGRTARAGKAGTCITFYTFKQQSLLTYIEHEAGIRFKKIGVPSPQEVLKAQSKGILTNLKEVNSSVIPLFEDTAKELVEQCEGDTTKALCIALAYISGNYKQGLANRSLMTGQERCVTFTMKFKEEGQGMNHFYANMRKYFAANLVDSIKNPRQVKTRDGVVFDLFEDQVQRFQDSVDNITDTVDFEVQRAVTLPELLEDEGAGRGRGSEFAFGQAAPTQGKPFHQKTRSVGSYSSGGGRGDGGFERQNSQYEKQQNQAPPQFYNKRSNKPPTPVRSNPFQENASSEFKAFVGNLNFQTNERDLLRFFRDFGINVLDVKIARD